MRTSKPPFIRKNIQRSFRNLDTDRDNTPDYKDCRPLNPLKQHIKPNREIEAELKGLGKYKNKALRIYIQVPSGRTFSLASKEANRYAPNAVRELYGIIKKYPSLLGMMRKSGDTLTYVLKVGEYEGTHDYFHQSYIYQQPEYSYLERRKGVNIRKKAFKKHPITGKRTPMIRKWEVQDAKNKILKKDSISVKATKKRDRMAKVSTHELHHGLQERKLGTVGYVKRVTKEKQIYGKYKRKYGYYWLPLDLNAEWHARKLIEERKKKGKKLPPKSFNLYD